MADAGGVVEEARFWLFGDDSYGAFERALAELGGN
jgi:hypothetical protein